MKHIKLFEELRRETYISAADKLKSKGHVDRAKALYDKSYTVLDRLDPNKYTIEGNLYQIVDIIDPDENDPDDAPQVILQHKNSRVAIFYGMIVETDEDGEIKESDKKLWIKELFEDSPDPARMNYWGEYTEDDHEYDEDEEEYVGFKFKDRKDARNFRKFLSEQFPDYEYDQISINDMYI